MTGDRWIRLRNRAFWAFVVFGLAAVVLTAAALSTGNGWLGGIAGALAVAAFAAVLAYTLFAVTDIRRR